MFSAGDEGRSRAASALSGVSRLCGVSGACAVSGCCTMP
jgi:hypothetical protein